MWYESIMRLFIFFWKSISHRTQEAWGRKKERTKEGGTKRNSTSAGQSYSLKSGDSFGRLRRWYLLGSIHKVAMATGQPGLSTPRPKSGKPVGPTNGRMYPGVRYWWLVVRANLRRADSRSRYTCLSQVVELFCLYRQSRTRTYKKTSWSSIQFSIFTQYLHIRTTKSWHGQHIHEVYPRNCPRTALSLVPFLARSTFAPFFVQKIHRFASLMVVVVSFCIRKEFEIRNKIFPNFQHIARCKFLAYLFFSNRVHRYV